jgi:2-keto-4-pentenoate hydratase/2-oxohepta-3-ene-1,7-dioic acid hydratase in catechol pathway
MSTTVLRTVDDWWALTSDGTAARIRTDARTTKDLMADREAVDAAAAGAGEAAVDDLTLLSPVTAPCRVVAQMTNYVSHVTESGMDPETIPLTFFRKTSGSITGPFDDIVRPAHVQLLDYEVELGLVIGHPLEVGDTVTPETWTTWIAGFVITNDVSARDVQLPKTQFFEGKSYPTFTPTGPALVLLDDAELRRIPELRLRLTVNGETRQDNTGADMIYSPDQALAALARFQRLDPGDLVLTGTPGGTALKAPPKIIEIIGSMLPPAVKWKKFFQAQAKNPKYLQDGDVVELTIATPDGAIDLGTQRSTVRFARWTS